MIAGYVMSKHPVVENNDELPAQSQLDDIVGLILAEATSQGASAADAGVSVETGLSVTVRLGEVETLEYHRDQALGVTVYFGNCKGSASTSDFNEQAVRESVQAACDIARYTNEDDCAGLADAELMAREIPDLDLYHPWGLSAEQAIDRALDCENAARELDTRITNSEGATLSSHVGLRVSGNTHGFAGGYRSSRHSVSCAVIGEQDGQMQRDYWYAAARDSGDMSSAADVGRIASERTLRRLGSRSLKTREAPVIFAAELASGLFGGFISAVRGGSQYRQSSFLLDYLGKQVFPEFMHIHEQPLLKKAMGSAPFDAEGVATRPRDLIRDGILESYVLDTYSARKLGMQTTGNAGGVHNLTIDHGPNDLRGLMKEMDTGLLVTELMGQGVNIVTGDYSRGAAGFWVEGGEIQYPVDEITIAGNLREMFLNIVDVGNDVDLRGNTRTGSVLVEKMMIAGNS